MGPTLLLAIECSGFSPRVALYQTHTGPKNLSEVGLPIAFDVCPADIRSAAALIPMIRDLYRKVDLPQEQTSAIAVTYGPGSFTSLRIGITTAKMLAYCWRVPAVPVNTLDWLLAAGLIHNRSKTRKVTRYWSVANAYRKQYFCKSVMPAGPLELGDSPEKLLEQKRNEFDAHFESAFALADTFDSDIVADDSPRFELNEQTIQQQESQFPQEYWKLSQATDAIDSEKWLTQILASDDSPQSVVVSDDKLADALIQRFHDAQHLQVVRPSESELNQAFGWISWQSLLFLSVEQLHPFRLQPIYYRPSAAEEAWAAKT